MNWNCCGAFCVWVTTLLRLSPRIPTHSVKKHLRIFVSGDTHKLIHFIIALERWVKKNPIILLFQSLYPKSFSNHIPLFLATTLRWRMLYFTRRQPSDTVCLRFFFRFMSKSNGVFQSFKLHLLLYWLFSCFFQNFTRTHWKIILLNVLKLSHTSFLIKAAFSAEACWTDKN